MEIKFSLNKDDLKNYYLISNRASMIAWGIMLMVSLASLIAGLAGAGQKFLTLGAMITILIIVFCSFTIFKVISVYKRSAKELKGEEIIVDINEDCFEVQKRGKIRWEYILELVEFKTMLIIRLPRSGVFLLPKTALDDSASAAIKEYYKKGRDMRKEILQAQKKARKK